MWTLQATCLPNACAAGVQETLEAGCKNVDDVVASLKHVSLKDRSMVWNTDLCEVPSPSPACTDLAIYRLAEAACVLPQ